MQFWVLAVENNMNLFSKFLTSKNFPFIVGGVGAVLVFLTILSFLPKKAYLPQRDIGAMTGLFGFPSILNNNSFQDLSVEETLKKQLEVSEDTVYWEKKIAGKYPWRKKLPLTSDKYYFYFDFLKKGFIGRLYPDNDDQVEQIKAEIIRIAKKEKDIPFENYPADWDVWPKSDW